VTDIKKELIDFKTHCLETDQLQVAELQSNAIKRIAELEEELSLTKDIIVAHQIADETGYIDGVGWVENWSEMEGKVSNLLEAHNLEQHSLAVNKFANKFCGDANTDYQVQLTIDAHCWCEMLDSKAAETGNLK
jgi:hypothetical protein